MIRSILPIILGITFLFSCDIIEPQIEISDCEKAQTPPDNLKYTAIYDQPVNLTEDSIFFAHEKPIIKWELPENLTATEIQVIRQSSPFSCSDYDKFHELGNSTGRYGSGYGNQYVHYLNLEKDLSDTVYLPYRIRSVGYDPIGYSEWTDVKSITIIPIKNFTKKRVTVDYNFNILTEELGQEYYSGVVELDGLKLEDIAKEYNLDYEKIAIVRPMASRGYFYTYFDDGKVPFSKLIVGFDENISDNSVYPFDVLTELFPGTYQGNPTTGRIYQSEGRNGNIKSQMQEFNIKLAYVLSDSIGKEHEVKIQLDFDIYFTD